jgi:spore maturation protein CgeB
MGHEFQAFTADDDLKSVLENYRPDIFITASNPYYRRYLDYKLLKNFRDEGLFVLVKIDFWNSPMSGIRINEAGSLSKDIKACRLISSGLMGDAYFHVIEQGDQTMHGFNESTGCSFHTIPLAADKSLLHAKAQLQFTSDISYVGTNLPEKRIFFKNCVYPMGKKYDLRIYGQDWSRSDWTLGWLQRLGQYFNIKPLSRLRKPKLALKDEGSIYASSCISINVHEKFQRIFGGDCNERTFKIPLSGGFEVVDNVACIKKYFKPGIELVIAENDDEWIDMVYYYLKNPEKRKSIIEAGKSRVLNDHTYHNRVEQIIKMKKMSIKK